MTSKTPKRFNCSSPGSNISTSTPVHVRPCVIIEPVQSPIEQSLCNSNKDFTPICHSRSIRNYDGYKSWNDGENNVSNKPCTRFQKSRNISETPHIKKGNDVLHLKQHNEKVHVQLNSKKEECTKLNGIQTTLRTKNYDHGTPCRKSPRLNKDINNKRSEKDTDKKEKSNFSLYSYKKMLCHSSRSRLISAEGMAHENNMLRMVALRANESKEQQERRCEASRLRMTAYRVLQFLQQERRNTDFQSSNHLPEKISNDPKKHSKIPVPRKCNIANIFTNLKESSKIQNNDFNKCIIDLVTLENQKKVTRQSSENNLCSDGSTHSKKCDIICKGNVETVIADKVNVAKNLLVTDKNNRDSTNCKDSEKPNTDCQENLQNTKSKVSLNKKSTSSVTTVVGSKIFSIENNQKSSVDNAVSAIDSFDSTKRKSENFYSISSQHKPTFIRRKLYSQGSGFSTESEKAADESFLKDKDIREVYLIQGKKHKNVESIQTSAEGKKSLDNMNSLSNISNDISNAYILRKGNKQQFQYSADGQKHILPSKDANLKEYTSKFVSNLLKDLNKDKSCHTDDNANSSNEIQENRNDKGKKSTDQQEDYVSNLENSSLHIFEINEKSSKNMNVKKKPKKKNVSLNVSKVKKSSKKSNKKTKDVKENKTVDKKTKDVKKDTTIYKKRRQAKENATNKMKEWTNSSMNRQNGSKSVKNKTTDCTRNTSFRKSLNSSGRIKKNITKSSNKKLLKSLNSSDDQDVGHIVKRRLSARLENSMQKVKQLNQSNNKVTQKLLKGDTISKKQMLKLEDSQVSLNLSNDKSMIGINLQRPKQSNKKAKPMQPVHDFKNNKNLVSKIKRTDNSLDMSGSSEKKGKRKKIVVKEYSYVLQKPVKNFDFKNINAMLLKSDNDSFDSPKTCSRKMIQGSLVTKRVMKLNGNKRSVDEWEDDFIQKPKASGNLLVFKNGKCVSSSSGDTGFQDKSNGTSLSLYERSDNIQRNYKLSVHDTLKDRNNHNLHSLYDNSVLNSFQNTRVPRNLALEPYTGEKEGKYIFKSPFSSDNKMHKRNNDIICKPNNYSTVNRFERTYQRPISSYSRERQLSSNRVQEYTSNFGNSRVQEYTSNFGNSRVQDYTANFGNNTVRPKPYNCFDNVTSLGLHNSTAIRSRENTFDFPVSGPQQRCLGVDKIHVRNKTYSMHMKKPFEFNHRNDVVPSQSQITTNINQTNISRNVYKFGSDAFKRPIDNVFNAKHSEIFRFGEETENSNVTVNRTKMPICTTVTAEVTKSRNIISSRDNPSRMGMLADCSKKRKCVQEDLSITKKSRFEVEDMSICSTISTTPFSSTRICNFYNGNPNSGSQKGSNQSVCTFLKKAPCITTTVKTAESKNVITQSKNNKSSYNMVKSRVERLSDIDDMDLFSENNQTVISSQCYTLNEANSDFNNHREIHPNGNTIKYAMGGVSNVDTENNGATKAKYVICSDDVRTVAKTNREKPKNDNTFYFNGLYTQHPSSSNLSRIQIDNSRLTTTVSMGKLINPSENQLLPQSNETRNTKSILDKYNQFNSTRQTMSSQSSSLKRKYNPKESLNSGSSVRTESSSSVPSHHSQIDNNFKKPMSLGSMSSTDKLDGTSNETISNNTKINRTVINCSPWRLSKW